MAASDTSSVPSSSSSAEQRSQQPQTGEAPQTSSPRTSGTGAGGPPVRHTSSSSTATREPTASAGHQRGAEAATGGKAATAGSRRAGDEAAAHEQGGSDAAPPAGAAGLVKAAGVSSRRLSQLQMTQTMQTFAGGRGAAGAAGASRPTKTQKQPHERQSGASRAQTGRGAAAPPLPQQPRWHGGSSVSGCRGIEFQKKKAGGGSAVRRVCLYGSGALWIPAQQLLGEHAAAPGVAGQPSFREDLRMLPRLQQEGSTGEQGPQQRWCRIPTGGGRRNASSAVAAALLGSNANFDDAEQRQRPAIRSLRSYYGPEDLHCAFAQTLQVTNPLTGHMQVMAARRPGFAAAVVNIQDFDAYTGLQVPKPYASLRQKDSLQAGLMGLMPVAGAERLEKTRGVTAYPELKKSHLGCTGAFIAPLDDAPLSEKRTGHTKKRSGYQWASSVNAVPYATWKDTPQSQQEQQRQDQQRRQLAYMAGVKSWQEQVTGHQQQEGGRRTQQQQQMEKECHEWQGQEQQQRGGELQEQRQQDGAQSEVKPGNNAQPRDRDNLRVGTPDPAGLERVTASGASIPPAVAEANKTAEIAARSGAYTPNGEKSELKGKSAGQELWYRQHGQQQPRLNTQQHPGYAKHEQPHKNCQEVLHAKDHLQTEHSQRNDITNHCCPGEASGQPAGDSKIRCSFQQEKPLHHELERQSHPVSKDKEGTRLFPINGRQQQHWYPPPPGC